MNTVLFSVLGVVVTSGASSGAVPMHRRGEADEGGTLPVRSASWGDWNGDRRPDLLVVQTDGRLGLYESSPGGELETVTIASGLDAITCVTRATWGDLDGDEREDLVLLKNTGEPLLYFNRAAGFEPLVPPLDIEGLGRVCDAEILDVDGDGLSDIWLEGTYFSLLWNRGEGLFERRFNAPLEDGAGQGASRVAPVDERGSTENEIGEAGSRASSRLPFGAAEPGDVTRTAVLGPTTIGAPISSNPICAGSVVDQATGSCLQASSTPSLGLLFPLGPELFVDPAGRVGIGTLSPIYELDVSGTASAESLRVGPEGDNFRVVPTDEGEFGPNALHVLYGPVSNPDGEDSRLVLYDNGPGSMDLIIHDGRLGIGITEPNYDLDVIGTASAESLRVGPEGDNFRVVPSDEGEFGVNALHVLYGPVSNPDGGNSRLVLYDNGPESMDLIVHDGRLGIGTTAPQAKLDVRGTIRTQVLEITGGADLAEGFRSAASLKPGTVVVVDSARPGWVAASSVPYDRAVVGIVSGAGGVSAGLRLGQDDLDGELRIAMVGRVYARCCTENGPIGPGDRLTSSAQPGIAMRATDADRSSGAVLGKALTSLDSGSGLVLVLVDLQ